MKYTAQFTLSYEGNDSDRHEIDLYDVSQALIGFQRSIALTTHLVINNKIITQAPALKGAQIIALPPEEGSWKITAGIILTGVYSLGTLSNDSPLGHIVHSVYDYVISESLGFHVDYDKSLGQLYKEHNEKESKIQKIEQHQVDSLIEKCSTAIKEIHRPIYKTKTAETAKISTTINNDIVPLTSKFSMDTFQYMSDEFVQEQPVIVVGVISSYNSNTFKGRIYVAEEGRPVSFELSETCRKQQPIQLIIASLSAYANKNIPSEWSHIYCKVWRNMSRSGHLKSYSVISIVHTKTQA